jgi:hypothetical protein
MSNTFDNQIQNRNFLSPVGFNFSLAKNPKISFFCNSVRIPEITLGTAIFNNYLKAIEVPGEKIEYGDFYLKFLVDENMENYMAIHNWITGLGFPETTEQFKELITNSDQTKDINLSFSDGTLRILNNNYNSIALVKFKDLFPVSLSSLEFESNDSDYNFFTAEVVFKYTIYNIVNTKGNPI